MTRSEPRKRKTRSSGTLLEKAVFAAALGLLFLILPLFFGGAPGIAQIRAGLLWPGVLALAIGLLLLAVHRARRHENHPEPVPQPPVSAAAPGLDLGVLNRENSTHESQLEQHRHRRE